MSTKPNIVISVVGIPITVFLHEDPTPALTGTSLRGKIIYDCTEIHLDATCAPHILAATFIHEIIHFIDNEVLGGVLREETIRALATSLASVFAGQIVDYLTERTEESNDTDRPQTTTSKP